MFIRHQLKRFSFPRRSEMSANRLAWMNLKWEEILFLLQNLGHTELLEENACEFLIVIGVTSLGIDAVISILTNYT